MMWDSGNDVLQKRDPREASFKVPFNASYAHCSDMIIPLSDSDLPLILQKVGESEPSVRHFLKGALTLGSRLVDTFNRRDYGVERKSGLMGRRNLLYRETSLMQHNLMMQSVRRLLLNKDYYKAHVVLCCVSLV